MGGEVDIVAAELAALGDVRPERALSILEKLRAQPGTRAGTNN